MFDPFTVDMDDLEAPDTRHVPRRIVGRYPRAVVVEYDLSGDRYTRYKVIAFSGVRDGPYEVEHPVQLPTFSGLSEDRAHAMARDWTDVARF